MSTVNNIRHFLVVHDRRYKEWTFVTGGCRRREIFNPLRCAVRELEEETRGLINLKRGSYTYFKFLTDTPEPRDVEDGVDAENHYHVYLFDLPMTALDHSTMTDQFTSEMSRMDLGHVPFRKNYDENDDFKFVSLDAIENIPNLWPMIQTHVLRNPEFHRVLEDSLWTPFNLR